VGPAAQAARVRFRSQRRSGKCAAADMPAASMRNPSSMNAAWSRSSTAISSPAS